MPITASDAISGSIYVVATDANTAKEKALDYLRGNKNRWEVFETEDGATSALHNENGIYDRGVHRVYAVSLDIRATEK
jgi:hypothetical protein